MSQEEEYQRNCCADNVNKHFFLTSVTFKVGNEMFQIPRFLFPTSEKFISRYPSYSNDRNSQTVLNDCTQEQFKAFLTVVLQPLKYNFPFSHPLHDPLHLDLILSALELASKWRFKDTHDDLKDKASCLIPTAYEKIALGKKYKMFSWFRDGLEELVVSDEDISLDDANVIGMGFALRVYHARSRYTRERSVTSEVPEIDSLKNAIEQVFAADLESFTTLPEDHVEEMRIPVHVEDFPQEEPVPLAANDRSPSFVSVAAELNSSTVVCDEHEVEVLNHHDYSTDGEYYTRPPSLSTDVAEGSFFGEDSLLSDAPSFEGTALTVDEGVVTVKPSERDLIVIQTTMIQPVDATPPKDEDITTPRPTIDPHVSTASSSSSSSSSSSPLPPPSPPTFRESSAPAVLIPVAQSPAGVSPANTQTSVVNKPLATSTSQPVTKTEPVKITAAPPPKASSSSTTTTKQAAVRDDILIRDVLRCILDPAFPMPKRVPAKVPKTCCLLSEDCGPSMRCDPCCLREARRYRSLGWLPKASTPHGQVFLDAHLNGSGLTTLKETSQFIPKTCKKSGKKCGGQKRCMACCQAGVKAMMNKGEIV